MNRALTGEHAPAAAAGGHGSTGASLVELLLVLAVAALVTVLSVPVVAQVVSASDGRAAAHLIAGQLRAARQHAILTGAGTALVFTPAGTAWSYQLCSDGNGNGVRHTDIAAGIDACPAPAVTVGESARDAAIAVDPALPGPNGDPPTSDPLRFGQSDMASFSTTGSGTAGTVFIRSRDVQYAVRIGNMTGRTRVLRYDPGRRTWVPG